MEEVLVHVRILPQCILLYFCRGVTVFLSFSQNSEALVLALNFFCDSFVLQNSISPRTLEGNAWISCLPLNFYLNILYNYFQIWPSMFVCMKGLKYKFPFPHVLNHLSKWLGLITILKKNVYNCYNRQQIIEERREE